MQFPGRGGGRDAVSTSLFLDVFPVGPIQANCVLLGDRSAGELVVIDAGEEGELVVERVRASGLRPTMILHTHGHLDHVGGTAEDGVESIDVKKGMELCWG